MPFNLLSIKFFMEFYFDKRLKIKRYYLFQFYFVLICPFLWLPACDNEEYLISGELPTNSKGIYIVNEGNLTQGNASLSLINYDSLNITNQIFRKANNRSLGDVAQSLYIIDTVAYIVINNSARIEVVSLISFKSLGQIVGFSSPRYFLPIDKNFAYVSDLYHTSLYVVDLNLQEIVDEIYLGKTSEQMVLYNEKVYVANWSFGKSVQVVNTATKSCETTIDVPFQPVSIKMCKNNRLFVLCDGGYYGNPSGYELPALVEIDVQTNEVVNKMFFAQLEMSPTDLQTNRNGDSLWFINKSIFAMSIDDNVLPTVPVIHANGRLFYSLGINSAKSLVVVGDAIDYQQLSDVIIYDTRGNELKKLKAGIIPGHFEFTD